MQLASFARTAASRRILTSRIFTVAFFLVILATESAQEGSLLFEPLLSLP